MELLRAAAPHEREDHKADDGNGIGDGGGEVRVEADSRELDAQRLRKAKHERGQHAAEAFAAALFDMKPSGSDLDDIVDFIGEYKKDTDEVQD